MIISIDMGSKYIHIIEGKYEKNVFRINKHISVLSPEHVIEDGEIIDEKAVINKLKTTLEKHHIKTKKVVYSINPGSMIRRKIEIPQVKPKEILPILQNQIQTALNSSEEYIIDYTEAEYIENNMLSIDIVAMPKSLVEQYIRISKELKLKPLALDISQNAVSKFFNHACDKTKEDVIVADIGNSYMNLYLFNEGVCTFATKSFINTEQYERMLVSSGKIKKINEGFQDLDLSPKGLENDETLQGVVSLYLYDVSDSIQRMIQFHLGRAASTQRQPISQIYLFGGMANMMGLTAYIQASTEIPVVPIGTEVNNEVCKCEDVEKYINALGALIRVK